jgi:hypothetical protein
MSSSGFWQTNAPNGILRQHDADQQAACAASHRAQLSGRRDAGIHQMFCNGSEVLGDLVPVRAYRLLVPCRTVFPAAADVRQCVAAAAGQPQASQWTHVARQLCGPESAVAIQQHRTWPVRIPMREQEVRHAGTVGGSAEVLRDDEVVGVEERRRGLDLAHASGRCAM